MRFSEIGHRYKKSIGGESPMGTRVSLDHDLGATEDGLLQRRDSTGSHAEVGFETKAGIKEGDHRELVAAGSKTTMFGKKGSNASYQGHKGRERLVEEEGRQLVISVRVK